MKWRRSSHPAKAAPEKRTADGYVFDSIPEKNRYVELAILQRSGTIRKLQIHTKFKLEINDIHLAYYTADFTYIDCATNRPVVEDVKGHRKSKKTGKMLPRVNRDFGLKKRLMKALFDIDVEIV
jgi:hypothetical protein